MSKIQTNTATNSARDYAEIGAAFLIVLGILFALGQFNLLPKQFGLSTTMSYGLVFVIGLVASVSSCIAVTGGLLVAVAAKYNETTAKLDADAAYEAAYLFQRRTRSLLHVARRSHRRARLGAHAFTSKSAARCRSFASVGHDSAWPSDAQAFAGRSRAFCRRCRRPLAITFMTSRNATPTAELSLLAL